MIELGVAFLLAFEALSAAGAALAWHYRHKIIAAIRDELHANIRLEIRKADDLIYLDLSLEDARHLAHMARFEFTELTDLEAGERWVVVGMNGEDVEGIRGPYPHPQLARQARDQARAAGAMEPCFVMKLYPPD